jgi:threonine/homoserine/homoserine lactone efflux protein
VCLRGFLGVDAYAFGSAWLLGNLLFGVMFLVVMVWASRRYGDRMQKSPAIQRLMNTIAGRELTAALAFLESLSRLETEDALG